MTEATGPFQVEFDPRLVEEGVLRVIETQTPERRALFRRDRDSVYKIADPEAREARFRDLHARWFTKLTVGRPIFELLGEQPLLMRGARVCLVLLARGRKQEGADLYAERTPKPGQDGIRPVLIIRVQTETLLDGKALCLLMRHELGHVADMLNPDFGYEPDPGGSSIDTQLDNLVRARYHLLWDVRVDGRLAAAGLLPEPAEQLRRKEFARAFPMLGRHGEAVFARFFHSQLSTHKELLALARNPRLHHSPQISSDRCSLCNSLVSLHGEEAVTSEVIGRIQEDFSEWRSESGLCRQCADLYTAKTSLRVS